MNITSTLKTGIGFLEMLSAHSNDPLSHEQEGNFVPLYFILSTLNVARDSFVQLSGEHKL